MFELSEYIYNLLNVTAVTSIATGGIYPLLAEQETQKFVTYSINSSDETTKDGRTALLATISCYGNSYNEALQMLDAVDTEFKKTGAFITSVNSGYVEETNQCAAIAVFNIRRSI